MRYELTANFSSNKNSTGPSSNLPHRTAEMLAVPQ